MSSIKNNIMIIVFIILAIVLCLVLGYFLSDNEDIYYTQIDNSKISELQDAKDNMKYEYTLTCYNEKGKNKELKFKTSRELRNEAFLKLEVMHLVGVRSWEEVQLEELPSEVRAKY